MWKVKDIPLPLRSGAFICALTASQVRLKKCNSVKIKNDPWDAAI